MTAVAPFFTSTSAWFERGAVPEDDFTTENILFHCTEHLTDAWRHYLNLQPKQEDQEMGNVWSRGLGSSREYDGRRTWQIFGEHTRPDGHGGEHHGIVAYVKEGDDAYATIRNWDRVVAVYDLATGRQDYSRLHAMQTYLEKYLKARRDVIGGRHIIWSDGRDFAGGIWGDGEFVKVPAPPEPPETTEQKLARAIDTESERRQKYLVDKHAALDKHRAEMEKANEGWVKPSHNMVRLAFAKTVHIADLGLDGILRMGSQAEYMRDHQFQEKRE